MAEIAANASWGSGSGSSGSTPAEILSNYAKFFPGIMNLNQQQLAALMNTLAQSGEQAVTGAGGRTVESLMRMADAASPNASIANAANARSLSAAETAASGAAELQGAARAGLRNVDLTGLSPGEYNAAERSLNQDNVKTGNMGLLNPMNVIKNAMNFGGAFNAKNNLYQTALSGLKSAWDAVGSVPSMFANTAQTASGTDATKAGTAGIFNTIANPASTAASTFGTLSGQMGQMATGNKSQSENSNKSFGVGCCFIVMEAYHGTMPPSIRRFRDKYYRLHPEIADGYKRMAHWLVPMMQKYDIVRNLVWNLMISPATKHCEHSHSGWNKRISHFWLRLWAIYGKL